MRKNHWCMYILFSTITSSSSHTKSTKNQYYFDGFNASTFISRIFQYIILCCCLLITLWVLLCSFAFRIKYMLLAKINPTYFNSSSVSGYFKSITRPVLHITKPWALLVLTNISDLLHFLDTFPKIVYFFYLHNKSHTLHILF